MNAARAKCDDGNGRHLSEAEMIAYCQERMAASEREAARPHILQCNQCLQLFKDVSDFFEPRREDEEEIDQSQIRRAWNDFWPRAHVEKIVATTFFKSLRAMSLSGAALPLAAGLLITCGLATFFVWRERQEKQQAQQQLAQLQSRQRDIEARLSQIERTGGAQLNQESEQRTQAEARAQSLQTQLNELQQGQQNVPIYARTLSSEKGEGDDWQLSVPSTAKTFWLSLTRSKPYEFPEYSIKLLDQRGKPVAERQELRPVGSGYLSFALSRSELQSGKYSLLLYGRHGNSKQKLGEYELSLSYTR